MQCICPVTQRTEKTTLHEHVQCVQDVTCKIHQRDILNDGDLFLAHNKTLSGQILKPGTGNLNASILEPGVTSCIVADLWNVLTSTLHFLFMHQCIRFGERKKKYYGFPASVSTILIIHSFFVLFKLHGFTFTTACLIGFQRVFSLRKGFCGFLKRRENK